MRQLLSLFAFFILVATTTSAQTKMIAFKSHAGDMDFFVPDAQPEDDFGLPPSRMTRIVRINDSTVVEHAQEYDGVEMIDTVVNHIYLSNPKIGLDSLKKLYPEDIIFEGFDNKAVTPKENSKKTTSEENKALKKEPKKKKKKELERADALGFVQPNSGNSGGGNIALFVVMAIGYGLVLSAILLWLKPNKTQVA